MAERNYPCDNLVIVYFGGTQADLDAVGESAFKKQLFQCLIGQALVLKGYISQHHNTNTFGLQIWQLNEIWPTGGWGTIEYGTPTVAGQVVGGRWKPAHHWLRESLYTDQFITCGHGSNPTTTLTCMVKNQLYSSVNALITVTGVDVVTGVSTGLYKQSTMLPGGPGTTIYFQCAIVDATRNIVIATVTDNTNNQILTSNTLLLTEPYHLQLQSTNVTTTIAPAPNPDGSIDITIGKKGNEVALFVTLTTLAAGRFSFNSFAFTTNSIVNTFFPFGTLDVKTLTNSLRVEHVNMYL